jgi:serine phosphatase RsbU (regulator of sigma subunit)/anti-sigma regulatory factor (Ser/Thr protein kinase)
MRSMIVVPLLVGTRTLGAMAFLQRSDDAAYDRSDVNCAEALGRLLGLGLENAALREKERRVTARAHLLGEATDRLFSTSDENEMLDRLVNVVVEEFADLAVAVAVSGDSLVPIAASSPYGESGDVLRFCDEHLHGPQRASLVDAIRRQQPLLNPEPAAWMMAPLFASGREYGAVFCHSQSYRYDAEDLEALRELCRRTSLALEYANSFARERRLAQALQRATLPAKLAQIEGVRADVVYQPAAQEEQVGGDWYDLFSLGEHRILASIGDVTGHGLPAWAVMSKLRHSLNVVAKYETDPSRILDVVEEIVLLRYPDATATAFLAVLDLPSLTLTYANAGHPAPAIRYRNGTVEQLPGYGLPIGVRKLGPASQCATVSLRDIDLLVFYTDGLIESTRNAVEGERWLLRALRSPASFLTVDSAEFVKSYCLRGPVPDDVAVLALNFVSINRWSFSAADQQAAQAARNELYALLLRSGMAPDDCTACELIFGELIGNVARHAPGPLEAALEFRDDRAVLHVIDRGGGYRIARLVAADVFDEGGRGLWLAQRLGSMLEVEPIPGFGTRTSAILPGRCRFSRQALRA